MIKNNTVEIIKLINLASNLLQNARLSTDSLPPFNQTAAYLQAAIERLTEAKGLCNPGLFRESPADITLPDSLPAGPMYDRITRLECLRNNKSDREMIEELLKALLGYE